MSDSTRSRVPARSIFGWSLVVAISAQILVPFGCGFFHPMRGAGTPPVALAASIAYATAALLIFIAMLGSGVRPFHSRRISLGTVMIFIGLMAIHLLFLRYWLDRDREMPQAKVPDHVISMAIYYPVAMLGFLVTMLTSITVLACFSRTVDDRL